MEEKFNEQFSRKLILIFLKLCVECELKKGTPKKGIVVKPIVSKEQNERCQVDLIDLQACPNDEYKYIMVYQDQEREDQNSNRNVGDENKMELMVLEQREQDIEVQRSGAREAQQEQAQKMELMLLEQREQDIEVQQPMSSQRYVP
uniref:Uncharacterized protein n=1 Tax=Acrobeloides nanus TaxID=290746 RepID=A0A914CNN5_9BILA